MGLRDLGTRTLCVYPGPLYCFFRGVRLSVGVKKWFEALTGKFLPFVVSYISHFICSYNLNYNFRPLRGPSIILIIIVINVIELISVFSTDVLSKHILTSVVAAIPFSWILFRCFVLVLRLV